MQAPGSPDAKSAQPRFEMLERAGRGSFAEVWKARDAASGALVALKVAHDETARAMLAREAAHAALALSPFLPELVDVGSIRIEGSSVFMSEGAGASGPCAMALVWTEGASIAAKLRSSISEAARLDLALSVARDVGEALSDLHAAGLAHGDIKPDNLIVDAAGRVHVIDLGLACGSQDREIEGASPRYLARGDADLGHARARDLAALGAVLAEIVDPHVARAEMPISAARSARLVEPLQTICVALLAPSPATRPSAAWVVDVAGAALATDAASAREDRARAVERDVRHVRASYLRLRRAAIAEAKSSEGDVAPWAAEAVAHHRRAKSIMGSDRAEGAILGPMDAQMLARWVTSLTGSAASVSSVGAMLRVGESKTAAALVSLARRAPPASWTSLDLESALSADVSATTAAAVHASSLWGQKLDATRATKLALALSRVPADLAAIEVVERTPDAPAVLLLAAVRALTLRGEFGRARTLVLRGVALSAADVDPVAADVLRRAGDLELASERARAAIARNADPDGLARASLARMALDAGKTGEAASIVEGAASTAALCEVSALVAVAEGDSRRAFAEVARGEAFARTPEGLARLAGTKAYVSHGHDPEAALEALKSAVDHAVRAGAVVEEASYATALAGAAADAGDIALAISSARR
ncbi:MAG: protein kinase, partial [Polyangiaceae bacterium]